MRRTLEEPEFRVLIGLKVLRAWAETAFTEAFLPLDRDTGGSAVAAGYRRK
jgi:hypothetical protein